MGNTNSNSEEENDEVYQPSKVRSEDRIQEIEHLQSCDFNKVNDLSQLFDNRVLRVLASKIKDEIPTNIIQQEHGALTRWLENGACANEETVTLAQFCDFMMNRVGDRDECVKAFQQFDCEGDGVADISTMLETLNSSLGSRMAQELGQVIRTLQKCTLVPGFIDVYTADHVNLGAQHGSRILNFVQRNRSSSSNLPYPALDGFNNIMAMREQVLNNMYCKPVNPETPEVEDSVLTQGEELVMVNKVYSHIEASSNQADVSRISNPAANSYWQSDGSVASHWIRLLMRPNVVLTQLSLSVSCGDESYMPQLVSVSVGENRFSLTEIKEIKIPSHVNGEVLLVENLQQYYKVIQIKIKRCHSDGCDTRIRGIRTLGYRIVREPGISVLDASAMWYFRVLASLGRACQSVIPGIRSTILDHSKLSLKHMPPLSLSSANTDKPSFLSNALLKEVHNFLTDMATCEDKSVSAEGVQVLLAFSLARGHVLSILHIIEKIIASPSIEVDISTLNHSMASVLGAYLRKSGQQLPLTFSGCDGGQKDENSPPQLVLSAPWDKPTHYYQTTAGRTKLNMFFKSQQHVQLTRVRIKFKKENKGPKYLMLFIYNDTAEFDLQTQIDRFSEYDDRTSQLASDGDINAGLVKFLALDEECEEVDIWLDSCPVGQNILVKMLSPMSASYDRMGIIGMRFFGFPKKKFQSIPLPEDEPVADVCLKNKVTLLHKILEFLAEVARGQPVLPTKSGCPKIKWLDTSGLSLGDVWQLYQATCARKDSGCGLRTECLILQFVHSLIPYIVNSHDKSTCEPFFEFLRTSLDQEVNLCKRTIIQQIITDGVPVFFADKESRRKQLFSMMQEVSTSPGYLSVFQALCHYYSTVDPTGLLDLTTATFDDTRIDELLTVMKTLLSVVSREFRHYLLTNEQHQQSTHVVELVSSLQNSLLNWCYRQLPAKTKSKKGFPKHVEKLIVAYSSTVLTEAVDGLKAVLATEDKQTLSALVSSLDASYLSTTIRQLCVQLLSLTSHCESRALIGLVHQLLAMAAELKKLIGRVTELHDELSRSLCEEREVVTLKAWEVESPHSYENNQHVTHEFYCPGATKFLVQFDSRCETEKRYDYLEFMDASGYKTRYDQKVGTEKWPVSVMFRGPRLQCLFHSDSSTVEWGYKFTVQAKGLADVSMSWPVDLQLSAARLTGRICGFILSTRLDLPRPTSSPLDVEEGDENSRLLTSHLWNTLLRGGHMIGRLQRSLSGNITASSLDTEAHTFIRQIALQETDLAKTFVQKCRSAHRGHQLGGEEVNEAVLATFAALLWHTQPLRDELDKYVESEGSPAISDGLLQAYSTADSIRNHILDLRQKQKLSEEKETDSAEANTDKQTRAETARVTEDIAVTIKDKALFLLSFAGLTKILPRIEIHPKKSIRLKKTSSHRRPTLVQVERTKYESPPHEKFPSFRLVLDFIKDPVWKKEKVEELLAQRAGHAQAVADTYMVASEYLRIMADQHIFQVTNILFLRELLSRQDCWQRHYADGLEGCGLELETSVRRAYYTLLRRLVDSLSDTCRDDKSVSTQAFDYIRACTLHLLDINWQSFDFAFLWESRLPVMLMDVVKSSVAPRVQGSTEAPSDVDEVNQYEQNLIWLTECKRNFSTWYEHSKQSPKDKRQAMAMFVARFCDLLDVEINCDGCHATLPGRRFRCMNCEDIDLCSTCFTSGVATITGAPDHNEEHQFVHLGYKCDGCDAFIVGTRLHCTVCEDYDLCVGCDVKQKYTQGHASTHAVRRIPMKTLCNMKKLESDLPAYIHQHAWLLYSSLSLSMAHLYHHSSLTQPYITYCQQIHDLCVQQLMVSLEHPHKQTDAVDGVDESVTSPAGSGSSSEADDLAVHSQERVMGLLGAMVPDSNNNNNIQSEQSGEDGVHLFQTKQFLTLLFTIAKGESGHETNTQHLAMGLLARLLHKTDTSLQVSDEAITQALASDVTKSAPTTTDVVTESAAIPRTKIDDVISSTDAKADDDVTDSAAAKPEDLTDSSTLRTKTEVEPAASDSTKTTEGTPAGAPASGGLSEESSGKPSNGTSSEDGAGASDAAPEQIQLSLKEDNSVPGDKTIEFLLSFGATCLERSGLEWAFSVVNLLQHLFTAPDWRPVLETHIRASIQNLDEAPQLTTIFSLFVVAGFPEVLSIGASVKYSMNGLDQKEGVVLKHFPDKHQSMIVDRRSRRRHLTKDEFVSVMSPGVRLGENEEQPSVAAGLLDGIISSANTLRDGGTLPVERMWMLALSLKTLHGDIRSGARSYRPRIYATPFLQTLVYLACQGTGFEKQWMLKDLEILSLLLYTMSRSHKSKLLSSYVSESRMDLGITSYQDAMKALADLSEIQTKLAGFGCAAPGSSDDDTTDTDTDTDSDVITSDEGLARLDVPSETSKQLVSIREALHTSMRTVVGLYENNNKDVRDVIDSINSHLIGLVESLKEGPKKEGSTVDEGIDITRAASPLRTPTPSDIQSLIATDEPCEKTQPLVSSSGYDVQRDVQKQGKLKSAELLSETLKNQSMSTAKEFLIKVNRAISVLYARDVIICLLADWPVREQPLSARILGCESDRQIPCLIDMLYNTDSLEAVKKMVDNLMMTCDESCLLAVSEAACHFVEEQSLTAVTKESEHNYKNNTELEDKVYIPGASFLSVRFDTRCHTEESCDVLILSTSPDYKQNKWTFSGSKENWRDFQVPGDTLYFKFTSDRSKNEWGYKFTVMGGRIGRFDTGFMILDALLLAHPTQRVLPLDKIWTSLCHVACRQTGAQRLRIINLLLKILERQANCESLSIEPWLVAPLWHLYTKMSDVPVEPGSIVSPLVRALTELFVVTESMVIDFGVDKKYAAAIRSPADWTEVITQGLKNVAAVSLAVNLENKLTAALARARSKSRAKTEKEP